MQKILIYRLGSVGDTIVALPSLRLVAKAFPGSRRYLLTNYSVETKAAPMQAVLEHTGLIDEFIHYPIHLRDPRNLSRLWRKLRDLQFHTLIYLAAPRGQLKALRDAAFFWSCGIRRQIGVPFRRELQRPLLLPKNEYEFEGARLSRCIAALGEAFPHEPKSYDLSLDENEKNVGARALESIVPGAPLLGVSVGAKVEVKDWGDANWRGLLSNLSGLLSGWGLVMVGSGGERERSESLMTSWRGPSVNLCGLLNVRESAAVLSECALYIGHDSGPMHLASAVGVPCVALFSSRNLPGEWFPQGHNHRVFYTRMPCQGCRLDVCHVRKSVCIRSITVNEVVNEVLQQVQNIRTREAGSASAGSVTR